jgi:hypothetical protein
MEPSITDLAKAAQSSYTTQAPENYSRIDELSSKDISTYKHNVNPHYIIAHRGTDVGSTTATKQLKADAAILFGNKNHDRIHKNRVQETERIVSKIKETDPEHTIHLSAHSLGGSTAQHAMIKSQIVRDAVKSVDTFNAGTSPLQSKGLGKRNSAYKIIADKSTHHSIQGDEISRNIKSNMIGKTKMYKGPENKLANVGRAILRIAKPHLEKSPLGKLAHFAGNKLINTLSAHSITNFL